MAEESVSDGGYWLEFGGQPLGAHEPQHVFCGPSGKTCPGCHSKLLRYADLDASDERLRPAVWPGERLALLFCWRCGVSQRPFHYRIVSGELRAVRLGRGPIEADFPYESYPDAFPAAPLRLVPVPPAESDILARVRAGTLEPNELWRTHPDLAVPRHHVALASLFLRHVDTPRCAGCGLPRTLLATFGDRNADARGFVGEDTVQVLFHTCPSCREVAVQQVCD